jgi:hypothetical protein
MRGRSFDTKEVTLTMPYVIRPTRKLLAAVTVAACVLLTVVAQAPAATATASVCVTPKFGQVFLPWNDSALYTLSPGGSFETGAAGWTLAGAAKVVAGNEPYFVGGAGDRSSLSLPAGGSAVSAPMCVDRTYPSFRFFARNLGDARADLTVEVQWTESGAKKSSKTKLDKKAGGAWAPVKSLKLPAGALSTGTLEPVTFRFTAVGAGGAWQIDDLYVDPYMRK